MKVLVRALSGEVAGHRGYPVAVHTDRAMIIVAATEGEAFIWGRLYLVQETNPKEHPWMVREVTSIPHEAGWELFEGMIDDAVGHEDTF